VTSEPNKCYAHDTLEQTNRQYHTRQKITQMKILLHRHMFTLHAHASCTPSNQNTHDEQQWTFTSLKHAHTHTHNAQHPGMHTHTPCRPFCHHRGVLPSENGCGSSRHGPCSYSLICHGPCSCSSTCHGPCSCSSSGCANPVRPNNNDINTHLYIFIYIFIYNTHTY